MKTINILEFSRSQLESLTAQLDSCFDPSDKQAGMVIGLLATASHLLEQMDSEVETEPEQPKRNLVQQMGGPLPSVPPSAKIKKGRKLSDLPKPPPVPKTANGIAGPEINGYMISRGIDPKKVCVLCSAAIEDHPIDQNAPLENNNRPYIACDFTRVYCD